MYKLEEVSKFAKASDALIKNVKDNLPSEGENNEMEGFSFEFNGKNYAAIKVDNDEVISEGKYENGGSTYQLVEYDKEIASYPCEKSITAKYDISIYVSWYRTGSYYSDWYYSYDTPIIQRFFIKDVPEQIISAHKEVVLKNYNVDEGE